MFFVIVYIHSQIPSELHASDICHKYFLFECDNTSRNKNRFYNDILDFFCVFWTIRLAMEFLNRQKCPRCRNIFALGRNRTQDLGYAVSPLRRGSSEGFNRCPNSPSIDRCK